MNEGVVGTDGQIERGECGLSLRVVSLGTWRGEGAGVEGEGLGC